MSMVSDLQHLKRFCSCWSFSEDVRDLTSDQEDAIRREVDAIKVEGDLRREVKSTSNRLWKCLYRGIRHRRDSGPWTKH